ncbi:class I SAM-dependent methyltransferase [Candidatus Woesearchaeota archaeon]|nr:class I SAM-dependent methyltransferase [Candidatus Woesearchaeota archaeon]
MKFTKADIIKNIEKKIQKLIKLGKTKEALKFRHFHSQEDMRDDFYNKLFMWGYAKDKSEREKLFKEAKEIAGKIPELKGWPSNARKFWDIQSYGWSGKIPKEIRLFIKKELGVLKGKNLSLGCGSYPYVEDSVLLDFSSEMLKSAKGSKKVVHDLEEKKLPFKDDSFDSVTMVFVADYIKNLRNLFQEIRRVLNKDGRLMIVQSKKPIDDFYRMHEKKHLVGVDLKKILANFGVDVEEKKVGNRVLVFVEAKKLTFINKRR